MYASVYQYYFLEELPPPGKIIIFLSYKTTGIIGIWHERIASHYPDTHTKKRQPDEEETARRRRDTQTKKRHSEKEESLTKKETHAKETARQTRDSRTWGAVRVTKLNILLEQHDVNERVSVERKDERKCYKLRRK